MKEIFLRKMNNKSSNKVIASIDSLLDEFGLMNNCRFS